MRRRTPTPVDNRKLQVQQHHLGISIGSRPYTGAMIGDQIGDAIMIQKPFTPNSLERKIREALDTPLAAKQQAS